MIKHRRAQDSAPVAVTSRLLPEVFAGFQAGERITVLDLGPGSAQTTSFLSNYRARIYYADLGGSDSLTYPVDELNDDAIDALVASHLGIPSGEQIDICLLWDYLHGLQLPILRGLSRCLTHHLHPRSTGYGFGALHNDTPQDLHRYGIQQLDSLIGQPSEPMKQYFGYTQQRLAEYFGCLKITRGTLLKEGRLELMFTVP